MAVPVATSVTLQHDYKPQGHQGGRVPTGDNRVGHATQQPHTTLSLLSPGVGGGEQGTVEAVSQLKLKITFVQLQSLGF